MIWQRKKDLLVEGATLYRNADYEVYIRQPEETLVYSDASCRVLPVNPKPLCKIGLQNILNRIKSPNQMPPHRIRRRENSSLIPFKSFLPFRLEPQILKTIENAPRTPTRLLMQE